MPRPHPPAALALAVLLLHIALLARWASAPSPSRPGPPVLALRAVWLAAPRQMAPPPASPPAPATTTAPRPPPTPAAPPAVPVPQPPRQARADADTEAPAPGLGAAVAPAPAALAEAAPGTPTPATAAAPDSADGASDGPADAAPTAPPPLYPARPAAAATWRFVLRLPQGGEQPAVLDWQLDAGRYRLELTVGAGGRGKPGLRQTSVGRIGESGLAPERFEDRRRGRAAQALSIDAAAGQARFSAVDAQVPAWVVSQDRLSWLLQLAAVADATAADPARPDIVLHVLDARGGSALWRFAAAGAEAVDTPEGPRPAQRWRRDPDSAEGLRVEVWLDPAAQHRPLRLRQTLLRNGAVTEWLSAP